MVLTVLIEAVCAETGDDFALAVLGCKNSARKRVDVVVQEADVGQVAEVSQNKCIRKILITHKKLG